MRRIFHTLVFIVPTFLNAQVYDTPIPLTQAMQGVTQAKFANVGGAGYQDICVSTYVDKRLVWYNGDGEGSFLAELELGVELDDIFIMAIGPVGDGGLNDIVVVTLEGNYYLIEHIGLDSYAEPILFASLPGTVGQLELMDLNGDSYMDLVSANEAEGLYYFPYTPGFGYGTLVPIHDETGVNHLDFGDFNNDGYTDITFIDEFQKLYWVEGLLGGGFETPTLLFDGESTGLRGVHMSDYDSDGDEDILAVAYQTGDIYFFGNLGSGTFLMSTVPHVIGVHKVVAIDMDDDGDKDLVLADDFEVSWIEQQGIIWASAETIGSFEGFFTSLDVKDIDNDGRGEVLLGSLDQNGIQYFENEPFHGFLPGRKISADAIGIVGIQLADIDGDGDKDIVSASKDDQKVAWYEKLSPGVFGPQRYITDRAIDTEGFLAMDYHGTGTQEVIVERKNLFDQPRLSFVDNDGTGQFAYPDDEITMSELYAMVAGHIDFDAKEDLVMASPYLDGRIIRVRLNNSNNAFIHEVAAGQGEVRSLAIADLDGDGKQDVIGSSMDQGLKWYRNTGNGTIYDPPQVIDDMLEIYHYVTSVDMDGDADQDLVSVVTDGGDPAVYWYENDGIGNYTRHATGLFSRVDSHINVGDVEGDGDIDILFSDFNGSVRWAINNGSYAFSQGPIICQDCVLVDPPPCTAIEDADGDGDLDVYFVDDEIYYSENMGIFCPEDINRDGWVDVLDFIEFNSQFGVTCLGYCPADINGDDIVDIEDFIRLNTEFGGGCN